MNLVDTSGWIEYFFGGSNARFFTPPIEDTDSLIVPVICLYEVFKKVTAVSDEGRALQAIAQMKQGRIADVGEEVALSAGLISLNHKLPMADSLIYATARLHDATVWTRDADFESLPGVRYMPAPKP